MRISKKPSTDALQDHLRQREEQPKLKAVSNYLDTYQSLPDRCHCVCLPRLDPAPELGESRPLALKHFLSNECTLIHRHKLAPYEDVLTEYEDLGHTVDFPEADVSLPSSQNYYLPAHGVVKESSSTVSFDKSARTSTGTSLNKTLQQLVHCTCYSQRFSKSSGCIILPSLPTSARYSGKSS